MCTVTSGDGNRAALALWDWRSMPGCTEQALAWVFSRSPPKSPPCGDAAALKPLNNRAAVTVATGCLLNPAHCLIPSSLLPTRIGTTVRLRLQGPSAAFDSICRARLEDNKSPVPITQQQLCTRRCSACGPTAARQTARKGFLESSEKCPKLQSRAAAAESLISCD